MNTFQKEIIHRKLKNLQIELQEKKEENSHTSFSAYKLNFYISVALNEPQTHFFVVICHFYLKTPSIEWRPWILIYRRKQE